MFKEILTLMSFIVVLGLASAAPADLVGHWTFDEVSGTVAADSSGFGNDGTLEGDPIVVDGQRGQALAFEDSRVIIAASESLTADLFQGPFTLAGWINPARAGNTWQQIFRALKGDGSSNDTLFLNNDGRLSWRGRVDGGWAGGICETAPDVVPADQWTHFAVTGDGTNFRIYVNAELTEESDFQTTDGDNATYYIAGNPGGESYTGIIDDVRVYDNALAETEIELLAARPKAEQPEPADGAKLEQTWAALAWRPGDFAVSHDVYMSDNFDDVNDRAETAYQGSQPTPFLTVGFAGFPFPEGLVPGTTYYWRVDEVNPDDPDSPWQGDVWSFWIPPINAYAPSPSDGSQFVATDVALNWQAGFEAKLHYIHFGDNFDDVNNATGGTPGTKTTFSPGALELGKTYYWRVDESSPPNPPVKGDVWSFTTTLSGLGTAVMDRWENITTVELDALKNDPRFPNNPDVTETVESFAWNGEDLSDYGARIEGWLYVPVTGDYTFWINTDDQGELWLSTDDDPGNGVLIAQESTWASLDAWGTGEEQSDAISLVGGEKYYITALWKEAGGGDHCQVAWQGPDIPEHTVIPGTNLSPFEPVKAFGAKPANGAVGASWTPTLRWAPGLGAASHEVYFGTDPNAVAGATKSSPEFKTTTQLGEESYEPAMLDLESTYYWRVDEVNAANPESPWVGSVWSFTTAEFGIVDDFESYNDIPAGEPGSNLVYLTWIDGFDNPNVNGSTMGYVTGASMETDNVLGGNQSVPFQYDNTTAAISEVVRTFTPAQDWTTNDLQTLSLRFAGDAANVPGQLYVKINGAQVNYGEMSNLTRSPPQAWNIDLAEFNTNLSNITSMTIGVQDSGATGTLLLDDIRLYAQPGESITPVQPDPAGLVAQFNFEGNANDSAGGHDGVPNGGPTYQMGKFGQAITLDGVDDHVVVGSVGISGADPRTIAGWAKASIMTSTAWVDVFGFTGPSGTNGHFDIELVGDTANTTLGWYGIHLYGWERDILPIDLEWHHLAASYDGTTVKWYGDGLLVGSADRALNTPDNVHIGKRQDNTNFFPGQLDDVRIYNRVLSDAEMAGLAGITQPFDKPF